MNDYQNFLNLLNNLKEKRPTLLLHSCCGPCSSYVIEKLIPFFKITIFYYNPNIYPEEEFFKRLEEQKKLLSNYKEIDLIVGDYNYSTFLDSVKGLENLGEKSQRCYKCYEFRIKQLSKAASDNNFDYFTTTLSVSPYKISSWINELGLKYQTKSKFLYSNFKKENGYQNSILLSKKYNLYRQEYCGCEFSLEESKRLK